MAKKKTRKPNKTKAPQQSNAVKAQQQKQSRRAFLQFGIAGAALIGGGGYFGIRAVNASISEADLTKLRNGRPTIVQIHDPNCPVCNALQRETRKAIKGMSGDKPQFLVANIKTLEGSTFAADQGVPHVTLLMFNAKGERVQVLRGPQQRDALIPIFEDHMARHARRS